MLKPTEDKKLLHLLEKIHLKYCGGDDYQMIYEMQKVMEKAGYRKYNNIIETFQAVQKATEFPKDRKMRFNRS